MPTNPIETHLGKIYGVRSWGLTPPINDEGCVPGPVLFSPYNGRGTIAWRPGEVMEAECRPARRPLWMPAYRQHQTPTPHEAPVPENCTCGIWSSAFVDVRSSFEPYEHREPDVPIVTSRTVTGIVSGWGTCVTGPKGQRTEFGRIEALHVGDRVARDAYEPRTVQHAFGASGPLLDARDTLIAHWSPHVNIFLSMQEMCDAYKIPVKFRSLPPKWVPLRPLPPPGPTTPERARIEELMRKQAVMSPEQLLRAFHGYVQSNEKEV